MLSFLKDHPFAVEAFFESSLVLTYAVPKEELLPLLPPCLELDVFNDQWGFVAIAMVQTKDLRPKGFPAFMGNDFFLVGYRVFVRYTSNEGKRLRGLFILRSATNKKKMQWMGNLFTHYRYTTTDIAMRKEGPVTTISSVQAAFTVSIEEGEEVALPSSSPFTDWKEARRFAGPLPFTFTYTPASRKVLIIEGVRQNWTPKPVRVIAQQFSFLEAAPFKRAELANAFIISHIPYYWKKGKVEIWKG